MQRSFTFWQVILAAALLLLGAAIGLPAAARLSGGVSACQEDGSCRQTVSTPPQLSILQTPLRLDGGKALPDHGAGPVLPHLPGLMLLAARPTVPASAKAPPVLPAIAWHRMQPRAPPALA
ncbi:hypothetical protein [Niveispirillum irakense]|uniref:hypothetical protein n=1 Tax=Niveispirillum irakense TaxID=34011 RepID=UPI0012B5F7FD|nr:hypothetical protein [Niveispirillum irakense]